MEVKLSNNRVVELHFNHENKDNARFTTLETVLDLGDDQKFVNRFYAFCHEKDNFCKEIGRKEATKRFIGQYKYYLSKEDKKVIWRKVLPKRNVV